MSYALGNCQNRPHLKTCLTALGSHSPLCLESKSFHLRTQFATTPDHSADPPCASPTGKEQYQFKRDRSASPQGRLGRMLHMRLFVFVQGSKFERLASERTPASDIGSSTKLEAVVEQVTKRQQVIVELKEALLNEKTLASPRVATGYRVRNAVVTITYSKQYDN
ncbi:hypothetical protein QQ045_002167 [Rhodiola kirilowii]